MCLCACLRPRALAAPAEHAHDVELPGQDLARDQQDEQPAPDRLQQRPPPAAHASEASSGDGGKRRRRSGAGLHACVRGDCWRLVRRAPAR